VRWGGVGWAGLGATTTDDGAGFRFPAVTLLLLLLLLVRLNSSSNDVMSRCARDVGAAGTAVTYAACSHDRSR